MGTRPLQDLMAATVDLLCAMDESQPFVEPVDARLSGAEVCHVRSRGCTVCGCRTHR